MKFNKLQYSMIFVCILLLNTIQLYARTQASNDNKTLENRAINLLRATWSQSKTHAGLGIDSLQGSGIVDVQYRGQGGDYHRAQEGGRQNNFTFFTDSYAKLSKRIYGYGSFTFDMGREKGRAWNDVRKIYAGSPFTYGSSIAGSYDHQSYRLRGGVATTEIGRFTYGLGLDYATFDLSRLKDPRTRTLALETSVIPSATFRISNNSRIGANINYNYQKDRMDNITTVQENTIFDYYRFEGLENYFSFNELGGFSQQNIVNDLGGELQYSYKTNKNQLLVTLGYNVENNEIWNSNRSSIGQYDADKLSFSLDYKYHEDRLLHNLKFSYSNKQGDATRFIQEEQVKTTDGGYSYTEWITIYKFITYTNAMRSATFDYRLYAGDIKNNDYSCYFGLSGNYDYFKNEYVLPYSYQKVGNLKVELLYGVRLLNKVNKLHLNFKVGHSTATKNKFDIVEKNVLFYNIIYPDYKYFNQNATSLYLDLQYGFRITTSKRTTNMFCKAFGDLIFAGDDDMKNYGISFGLYL